MRQPRLLTLGLDSRPLDETIQLLTRAGCRMVADVRTNPSSAFPPQYVRHLLVPELERIGIEYRWFRELGTMADQPQEGLDKLLHIPDAPGYAPRLNDRGFKQEVNELAGLAASTSVVVIATETDPRRCYRWILSDALFLNGVKVVHIIGPEQDREHALTPEFELEPEGRRGYQPVQLGIHQLIKNRS